MVAQRLEVNVHLVTSSVAATQNLVTAANKAGILISDTVLEPLASSEACLTQDERDLGCCLLDIGGGTTELIVFGGGVVRHTSAVAIGGDHFTNDLAVGLRTPIPEAERLKRRHGCAASAFMQGNGSIEIASVGDRPPRTIFAHMLTDIIEPRAMELLSLIRDDLQRAGLDGQLPLDLSSQAAVPGCTAWMNLPSSPSICPCASRNQKAWLICRNRWRSRNTQP